MTKLGLIPFVLLAVATGCKDNSQYCEGNPGNNCQNMWDGPSGCSTSAQCSGATPVCDVGTRTCVQCMGSEATACTGTTPVCGTDETCRGCTGHSECAASAACNTETGACIAATDVAYVEAGATGNCDKATPCGTMAEGLAKNRAFVKVTGALNETTTTSISRAVTIIAAAGASINTAADNVPVLSISTANADVAIDDLEITGGTMTGGVGVDIPTGGSPKLRLTRVKVDANQGGGITCSAGTLTVTQSTISGNTGGGIAVTSAAFTITNNFITRNGDSSNATIGGASLTFATPGSNRFEFNTVVDNNIKNTSLQSAGVTCDTAGFSAPNNIIARNFVANNAAATNANTLGQCMYPSSGIAATVTALKFASADNTPYNYHLTAGSSAIDQATTSSTVAVDVDGDARPQGSARDQGADEFKP